MIDVQIEKSQWGWTAYLPTGLAIAHSKNRELLDEYVAECVTRTRAPREEPRVAGRVLASRDVVPSAGARGASAAGTGEGARPAGSPLTEITYTTRARSTGATTSAGKTATGWGALCASHGTLVWAKTRTEAETIVSRPQEWCAGCAPIAAGTEPKIPRDALLEDLL